MSVSDVTGGSRGTEKGSGLHGAGFSPSPGHSEKLRARETTLISAQVQEPGSYPLASSKSPKRLVTQQAAAPYIELTVNDSCNWPERTAELGGPGGLIPHC